MEDMGDLPDEFNCTITNWEYIYDFCRDISDEVKTPEFEPDVIVALARGGWFAGRCICDFLGLDDLTSLKMEHYVRTTQKSNKPEVRYPMPEDNVEGKDVLIIDDIADTGGSIKRAHEHVNERNAGEVRTAMLQLLQISKFEPDYVGERLEEWAWVVYLWNFIEDMIDLTSGVMTKVDDGTFELEDIRHYFAEFHDVDRIEMETAQPNQMLEVMFEMERRGYVESTGDGAWRLLENDGVGA